MCLKDTGAKDNSTSYCPAEVLNNIGTTGTPITYAQGQIALKNPQAAVDGVPTWAYCTPCTQGLMVPVVNALNTLNPEWATIMTNAVDSKCGTGFVVTTTPASLESGITYEEPGAGNDTSTDGINGEGSGSGDEFDEGSTGFHTRSLATSGAVLLSLAALVVFGL